MMREGAQGERRKMATIGCTEQDRIIAGEPQRHGGEYSLSTFDCSSRHDVFDRQIYAPSACLVVFVER